MNKTETKDVHPSTASVPDLLDRAVSEMRDLTSVVNELEVLVGNLVLAGSFDSTSSIYDLQKLDGLRQSIGGIADFLDGIRRNSETVWTVDASIATEDVKLAELSERLRKGRRGGVQEIDTLAGDFEMFGDCELSKVA
jgi:hypothetical protein